MNALTITLLFTVVLYASAATDPQCIVPCQLGGFYSEQNGYECNVLTPGIVQCFCPGRLRFEINNPCRPCSPPTGQPPLCNTNIPQLLKCIETPDYGTGYACLCHNNGVSYATLDYDCGQSAILTTRPTTTTVTAPGGTVSICQNGGVLVIGSCQCPSGYGGQYCQNPTPSTLCTNVNCKNNAFCALDISNGAYVGVCKCRIGTLGEYCELNGTAGYCSQGSCLNGAACQENVVGPVRHAYCRCQPGYRGVKCETPYFSCTSAGNFFDNEMSAQGKYFSCTLNPNGTYRLEQRSCARGLRFNPSTNQCGY